VAVAAAAAAHNGGVAFRVVEGGEGENKDVLVIR
jgi:hypothetical protein